MKPTATLIAEHEVIVQMLAEAERVAQAPGALEHERVAELIEFYANFADRLHHAKEEQLLFPRLVERGMPSDGGPIGVMLSDHEEGRAYLKAARAELAAAARGEQPAVAVVREALLGFAALLRSHIHKENVILFRMADELLTAADQPDLEAAFERVNGVELAAVREQQLAFVRRVAGKPTNK